MGFAEDLCMAWQASYSAYYKASGKKGMVDNEECKNLMNYELENIIFRIPYDKPFFTARKDKCETRKEKLFRNIMLLNLILQCVHWLLLKIISALW